MTSSDDYSSEFYGQVLDALVETTRASSTVGVSDLLDCLRRRGAIEGSGLSLLSVLEDLAIDRMVGFGASLPPDMNVVRLRVRGAQLLAEHRAMRQKQETAARRAEWEKGEREAAKKAKGAP